MRCTIKRGYRVGYHIVTPTVRYWFCENMFEMAFPEFSLNYGYELTCDFKIVKVKGPYHLFKFDKLYPFIAAGEIYDKDGLVKVRGPNFYLEGIEKQFHPLNTLVIWVFPNIPKLKEGISTPVEFVIKNIEYWESQNERK